MPQAAPAHACVTQSVQTCAEDIHTCPPSCSGCHFTTRLKGFFLSSSCFYSLHFASQLVFGGGREWFPTLSLKASKVEFLLKSLRSLALVCVCGGGVCAHMPLGPFDSLSSYLLSNFSPSSFLHYKVIFTLFNLVMISFWDRVSVALLAYSSLCKPNLPWTQRDLPESASQVLELKVYTTMPGLGDLNVILNYPSELSSELFYHVWHLKGPICTQCMFPLQVPLSGVPYFGDCLKTSGDMSRVSHNNFVKFRNPWMLMHI